MNKSKIEWTDYTWNPIKGLCPVGCYYCYARKMYKSKFYSKPPFDNPRIRSEFWQSLEKKGKGKIKDGSKIFVCSTIEIFHPKIPSIWRDNIFRTIKKNPHLTFQILTKMPENIDRPMPDNVWLGVSITNIKDSKRMIELKKAKARIKFVSWEPMLEFAYAPSSFYDWLILGRLTGHGKKYDPRRMWIETMVANTRANEVPLFLKNNLKDIWGEDLIQEFPE